jgi:hypothetical protein
MERSEGRNVSYIHSQTIVCIRIPRRQHDNQANVSGPDRGFALWQRRAMIAGTITSCVGSLVVEDSMDAQQQPHSSQSSPNSQSSGSSFNDHAREAARRVSETAEQAQAQAREALSNLSSQAAGTVTDMLNSQVSAGAGFVSDLAHSIHCAADDLGNSAPQLGEFAHEAARQVDAFAARIREKQVDELFADASDFARRQPAIVFGAAAVLGFAMFRVLKVGAQMPNGSSSERRQSGEPERWPQSGQSDEVWRRQQYGSAE